MPQVEGLLAATPPSMAQYIDFYLIYVPENKLVLMLNTDTLTTEVYCHNLWLYARF
jgi:nicotinamide riboside kinase